MLINTTTDVSGRDLVVGTTGTGSLYVGDISFINSGGNRSMQFGGSNISFVNGSTTVALLSTSSFMGPGTMGPSTNFFFPNITLRSTPTLAIPSGGAFEINYGWAGGNSNPSYGILRMQDAAESTATCLGNLAIFPGKNTTL